MRKKDKVAKRYLKSNTASFSWPDAEFDNLETSVNLSVTTTCPQKYILIDMETGQVYVGTNRDNPYMPYTKLWEEQMQGKHSV